MPNPSAGRTIIHGGRLVNEGRVMDGTVVIEGGKITEVLTSHFSPLPSDDVIDAKGCFVLPGVIDDHVHFREPGLTQKADIDTESMAAAAGGVTSYFDMPNTVTTVATSCMNMNWKGLTGRLPVSGNYPRTRISVFWL